jgi:dCTP diphosphatase
MRPMTASTIDSLDTLRLRIREFAEARAWERYHTPKNLAMALSVEAAELLEPFQWLTPEQSQFLSAGQREAVRQEIADVLIYLTRLADVLEIDLLRPPPTSWRSTRASTRSKRRTATPSNTTDLSND